MSFRTKHGKVKALPRRGTVFVTGLLKVTESDIKIGTRSSSTDELLGTLDYLVEATEGNIGN